MTKNIKRLTIICILLLAILFINPINVYAKDATTLNELRVELNKLYAKKKKTENQKNWTKQQINQKNIDILNANKEIETSETKINEAKSDIENTKKKIKKIEEETKNIIAFYQKLNGENVYVEFITESSSMTELVMRIDAVKRIMKYNKDKLNDLEVLINDLEKLQVNLKIYQKELDNNISTYKNKIDELDSSLIAMEDVSMDINGEIRIVQDNIKNYKALGCHDNEEFSTCLARTQGVTNNTTWLKPTNRGIITSTFGRRVLNGKVGFHSGIDIGLREGTPVYSTTNGRVVHIVRRSSCGGNQIYIESIVNGKPYTMLYAHLLTIDVKLNQLVTNQTIIAKSGGGATTKKYDRCTTGGHLHFSVSRGRFTTWSRFQANLINPPGYPRRGVRYYSRTQWFE